MGAELARALRPGDVVLLAGEVGSGKTTLVRGALRALGVGGPVTSPTFTLGRRYEAPPARLPVGHLDLYRLGGLADEDPGLLEDYLGPDMVTFVEWPEILPPSPEFPRVRARVLLEHLGGDRRRVTVER